MIVINLFGEPSSGKSTTAAWLFSQLKLKNINCELITEFAKDLTYEKRFNDLSNQVYVFGKQLKRLERVKDHVDIAITDSPLLLSIVYAKDYPDVWPQFVKDMFDRFKNYNYLLTRNKPYSPVGRNQTEKEAKQVRLKIIETLEKHNILYDKMEKELILVNIIDIYNNEKNKCKKCNGSGWLWWDELKNYAGHDPSELVLDDTKYSCDECRNDTTAINR